MNIHLKTAFDYIKRTPFRAFAAIFILTLTFFVATLVSVLVYSSSKVLNYFETRPQIIAFLKDDANQTEIADLEHKLEGDNRIKNVKFVSKEEALSIYKSATKDNPLLGELVSPSIFPASLEFSVNDLRFTQNIIDEIKSEKIVDSVGFTASLGGESNLKDVVGRLKTITTYIRIGGVVFTGILALASFFMLLFTIMMRIASRKEEVEILKLIGATKSFISKPIFLESLIYTFLGVLVGWILAFTAVLYTAPSVVSYFGEIPVLPKDTLNLLKVFGVILSLEIVLASFLAFAGSSIAISRVKKLR